MNSVGLSNCASSEILGFEIEVVATAAAPTEVAGVSFKGPCTPVELLELRSCLRRAFCGFAPWPTSFDVAGPFSALSFSALSASENAVEGCVIAPPEAKVVMGEADMLLECTTADGDEDEDIDEGNDWLITETGDFRGGDRAALFGVSCVVFE